MSLARVAGIIALVSLVLPWAVASAPRFFVLYWLLFYSNFIGSRVIIRYVTQFGTTDAALSILALLAVLAGGIMLLASPRRPKLGSAIVLVGVLLLLIDILNADFFISFHPSTKIPAGFFIALAAGIMGMLAKVHVPAPLPQTGETTEDKLLKLKALLDSGAITQAEFEEQKRKLLEAG